MKRILLIAFCFLPQPEDAAKKDLAKLEGAWSLVAMEVDGKAVAEEKLKGTTLTIRGNKYSLTSRNKLHEVEIKLDAGKTPKEIDMTFLDGANKDRVGKGIYQIDGDKLKICRSLDPQDDRPKDFKTEGQISHFVMVWQKQP